MTMFNNEILWVTVILKSGAVYKITSDTHRDNYYLYKNDKKTKYSADDPEQLYKHCK